jgi:purine-binding chemotaxis protein CheW
MKKQQKLEEGLNRLFSSSRKSTQTPDDSDQTGTKDKSIPENEISPSEQTEPTPRVEFSVLLPQPEKPSLPLKFEGLDEESINLEHLQSLLRESSIIQQNDAPVPEENNPISTHPIDIPQTQTEVQTTSNIILPENTFQYIVTADISPKSIATAARAFQLLLGLQDLGTISSLIPSQEEIETAKPVQHVEATLLSSKTIEEIKKTLGQIDEVEKLSVTIRSNSLQAAESINQTRLDDVTLEKDNKQRAQEKLTTEKKPIKIFVDEQVVVFTLQKQLYGVSITSVDAIIKMQPITVVPGAPYYIDGVTNLRGTVLPVINLHKRLDLGLDEFTPDHRIIVVSVDSISAGMIVDSVSAVTELEGQNISEPSKVVSPDGDMSYIRAVAKHNDDLILLLELNKILEEKHGSL